LQEHYPNWIIFKVRAVRIIELVIPYPGVPWRKIKSAALHSAEMREIPERERRGRELDYPYAILKDVLSRNRVK
jgi:hypothetical protein